MQNIVQKVMRGIELKGNRIDGEDTNIVQINNTKIDGYENKFQSDKLKRLVNDSELLRIIEAIDKENVIVECDNYGRTRTYITGLISAHIGYNIPKYKRVQENDGLLIMEHYEFVEDKENSTEDKAKYKWMPIYKDNGEEQYKEYFVRLIVGSGHSRGKKALFIREDLYGKVNEILLGGIDELSEENGYPFYRKGCAKWNSYYGLASTDSKVVNYVPNIIIIEDFKRNVSDNFDMVYQDKSLNPKWEDGNTQMDKYIKKYRVEQNRYIGGKEIMPFDGAGLVSIECAKKWSEELDCRNRKGKSYVPASFQFRVIPGFKGNLYTFDLKSFGEIAENGYIITDIKGEKHDVRVESIDIILTRSQAKFIDFFNDDISEWRKIFDKPVIFYKKDMDGNDTKEIECSYKRTFNISEYAEDACDIRKHMLSAYQHQQTIEYTDEERTGVVHDTVLKVEEITSDLDKFLQYRNCTDDEEGSRDWKSVPPYFRAAYYCDKNRRNILFTDDFIRSKVAEEIEGIKNRALSGKLYLEGNYQVLAPDIYALAQFAFGQKVVGLLYSEEIYSNWWMNLKHKNSKGKYELANNTELVLIRNPHIYMEARAVRLLKGEKDGYEEKRYVKALQWFKYQTTGILTDSYSTIPLALGTADFDGDHIASTSCKEYLDAVKRARVNGDGNTVDYEIVSSEDVIKNEAVTMKEPDDISDRKKLMEFDMLAYQNNIGTVIDKVTMLWGMEQNQDAKKKLREYIVIADIIGQLTIDAAKTGEFEEFDTEILQYLRKHNAMKPYFMQYLSKNCRKKTKQDNAIENAKFFYGCMESIDGEDKKYFECIAKKQVKFSDNNTNINLICHYLEKEFANIDIAVQAEAFRLEEFLQMFLTDSVSETSDLYTRLKRLLSVQMKELQQIHSMHNEDYDENDEKNKHYRYFYENCRTELLNQCRLSEETSLNKVVNIIITICYREEACMDNTSAKNILWNSFGDELIERAKGVSVDKHIDTIAIAKRAEKTKKLKDRITEKKLDGTDVLIRELDDVDRKYNEIRITNEDIKSIRENIKMEDVFGNKKKLVELRRLYSVLLVISKRLEYDKAVKKPKSEEREVRHCIPILEFSKGNNTINASNLSKLAGFNETQRKRIKHMLRDLKDLGMIYIYPNDLSKIKLKVNYDVCYEGGSLVSMDDYVLACKELKRKFR